MSELRPLSFVVVGSARSGTTLVQRLLCELPEIAMPPETHFLSVFGRGLLARRAFPLDRRAIEEELRSWASLDQVRGLQLAVPAVLERLGERCDSLGELFTAVVDAHSGPGRVLGEKTPGHLLWWRPLTRALPQLRVVAVVRDPRAVVASTARAPWAREHLEAGWPEDELHIAIATGWAFEQAQVATMAAELGERCLVLRYEDVVTAPERAREALAAFLDVPAEGGGQLPPGADAGFVLPWEAWKQSATGPLRPERIDAWRAGELDRGRADVVASLCREGMQRFGYREGRPGPVRHRLRMRRLDQGAQRRLHSLSAWLQDDLVAVQQASL